MTGLQHLRVLRARAERRTQHVHPRVVVPTVPHLHQVATRRRVDQGRVCDPVAEDVIGVAQVGECDVHDQILPHIRIEDDAAVFELLEHVGRAEARLVDVCRRDARGHAPIQHDQALEQLRPRAHDVLVLVRHEHPRFDKVGRAVHLQLWPVLGTETLGADVERRGQQHSRVQPHAAVLLEQPEPQQIGEEAHLLDPCEVNVRQEAPRRLGTEHPHRKVRSPKLP